MFVDTVRIKSPDLKIKFLFQSFVAFRASLMQGETADCHMMPQVAQARLGTVMHQHGIA